MKSAGLSVEDLSVRISGARILDGASLLVPHGEIIGLAGRNGAGKTTLLRAISGITHRSGGTVSLDGKALPSSPELVARVGVAHIPEGRGIFPDLTVNENIQLGVIGSGARDESLRDRLMESFPAVERLKNEKAGRLSGGEQQMLALVRGLISRPKILLVDEMSLGLAPKAFKVAIEALVVIGRAEAIGMLIVDQNMRMLNDYCDRMFLLRDGRIKLWDSTSDLASAYFD